jgi:Zn-dependent M28 family amino/carboxypeptidase
MGDLTTDMSTKRINRAFCLISWMVISNAVSLTCTTAVVAFLWGSSYSSDSPPLRSLQGCCACFESEATSSQQLRNRISVERILTHLKTLQEIADNHGGSRHAGSQGYDDSVEYLTEQLTKAGYAVQNQIFPLPLNCDWFGNSILRTRETNYDYGEDFWDAYCSPGASADARTMRVDNFGCHSEDFKAFVAGRIAVIERNDGCFNDQAINAENAGATGVVVFNNEATGNLFEGTLRVLVKIPVFTSTYQAGHGLSQGVRLYMFSDSIIYTDRTRGVTSNIIAETTGGDSEHVVMAGAHLDSVKEGPGINDNGSGSAALLEIALQMAVTPTRNKLRFAWWGSEEINLDGSYYYVDNLEQEELNKIELYLNFDGIASPNFARTYYLPKSQKEAIVAEKWTEYFEDQGLTILPFDRTSRSDHYSFQTAGVTVGGLFAGNDEIKTLEQAELFGGREGVILDPCYHRPCDSIDNINAVVLEELAHAAAHAVFIFGNRDNSDLV